jgi:hypothetical protein
MRTFGMLSLILALLVGSTGSASAISSEVCLLDPNLPYYRPVDKLSGELKLGGSNTMTHVATVWINGFTTFYPDVKITVDVNGSRDAVESVQAGDTHIGLLSRTISADEVKAFQEKLGYPPTVLTPCLERSRTLPNLGPIRPHRRMGQATRQCPRSHARYRLASISARSRAAGQSAACRHHFP